MNVTWGSQYESANVGIPIFNKMMNIPGISESIYHGLSTENRWNTGTTL